MAFCCICFSILWYVMNILAFVGCSILIQPAYDINQRYLTQKMWWYLIIFFFVFHLRQVICLMISSFQLSTLWDTTPTFPYTIVYTALNQTKETRALVRTKPAINWREIKILKLVGWPRGKSRIYLPFRKWDRRHVQQKKESCHLKMSYDTRLLEI